MNLYNLILMAAPSGDGTQGSGSLISMLLPFLVIMVLFYILLVIPQKRQQKKHDQMLNSLVKGDKVVTNGGIHGTVVSVKENTVIVKVDESTSLEISRSSIAVVDRKPEETK